MKIYNETKTQILPETSVNLELGRLIEDKIVISQTEAHTTREESTDGVKISYIPENVITENILVYVTYTSAELKEKEISELEEWFEKDYRYLFEKYSRKIAMGLLNKDGSNPTMKLNELYALAETKAQRLHSLREQL